MLIRSIEGQGLKGRQGILFTNIHREAIFANGAF
jgi:hypothetical protein